ncbi:5-(carboxyamino)imidazole ribonucleotide synthase [Niallia sp. Krafla_26]|uniref:5-(carboxyamino)imidazole ribonucleotide synthase n=1 Tax=Niallia sp. Krafla_26 TaxID=3064703 RepID=UPI003D1764DE
MSNRVILPGETIGIIGGGQLGRMMALAAKAQGYRIAVLDPTEDCPCAQVADISITGPYSDIHSLQKLAEVSDVITYEFENIDANGLRWLSENAYVPQGVKLLEVTQNRVTEKQAIVDAGVEVAPYVVVENEKDIEEGLNKLGYPAVLKTARGGYDGKGQFVITQQDEIKEAAKLLQSGTCVVEKWVPYENEISVIVCRNAKGETAIFPVGENIHRDNILHETIVPARISDKAKESAVEIAKKLAQHNQLVGILAVEMFLTKEGIFVNELAPRPHNSGHYSIEACETSQFEQHIRSVCNLPLGSTELLKPVVMVNVLGEHMKKIIENVPVKKDWKIHLYGKKEAKEKRKMGHVTLLRSTVEEALKEIEESGIWQSLEK